MLGDATATGVIVEKAVDAARRYPFFLTELAAELTKRTDRTWNRFDVAAVIFAEKVKKSDNEFHHHFRKTNRHAYSEDFVRRVVRKHEEDATYVERARESILASRRKPRRGT